MRARSLIARASLNLRLNNYGAVYVVVFCRSTNPLSVVVVVVLEVTGGVTTTGAGAGAVSTTGAGVVASTVLWYEKHPAAIPHAATAAGIIAIRLKILICLNPPSGTTLITARSRPVGITEFPRSHA